MELIGSLLVILGLVGMFIGAFGVVKGSIKFAKVTSRKASLKFIGFAFLVMFVGAMFVPVEEETVGEDSTANTTVVDTNVKDTEETVEKEEPVEQEKVEVESEEKEDTAVVVPPTSSTTETQKETTTTQSTTNNTKLNGNLAVHFVDVGQGAAQVIITPNNKVMVIDGGNNSEEDTMVNYLNSLGIRKVDVLIGTHPDADHIGGLDAVVDHFDIGQVIMPKVQRDTQTFESLLTSIAAKGLTVTTAKAGMTVSLDSQVQIQMISPVVSSHSDANEMSAVVRIAYGNHSFLLTGDAGVEMESKWIANGANLQSTVLLVGHHGSEHSTSEAFIKKVKPTYAVIQVGKNSYGHPTSTVLNRLTNNGVNIYRNDTDGTIIFKTDGSKMTVNKNAWKNPNTAIEDKKPATQAPSSNNTVAVVPVTPTTPPATSQPVSGLKASATIDNPTPSQNGTVTVTVKVTDSSNQPVSGANVNLSLAFKSTTTVYEGTTDASGNASLTFKIGRAAKGFTVNGNITVTVNGQTATATTAFTPQ